MKKSVIQDKVRGTFLGCAIGDALGKPVESMTHLEIASKFGRIEDYIDCNSHKYFQNDAKGTTTDDWQLTKATIVGMNKSRCIDIDEIGRQHIKEYGISVRGWGSSTKESIENLSKGVDRLESSKTEKLNRGTGNGVCMKISPLGVYLALQVPRGMEDSESEKIKAVNQNIIEYGLMTHYSDMALQSGLVQAYAINELFKMELNENFDKKFFIKLITACCKHHIFQKESSVKLIDRMQKLENEYSIDQILDPNEFGNGSCYVYNSLPFTYAFFLRNCYDIDSLYDCVNAGGDTDTNGSMLGAMLGAMHGTSVFPKHLIDGLKDKDEVIALSDKFYDIFS